MKFALWYRAIGAGRFNPIGALSSIENAAADCLQSCAGGLPREGLAKQVGNVSGPLIRREKRNDDCP